MHKTETQEIQVTRTEQTIIHESKICNKCGKEFTRRDKNDFGYDTEIHNLQINTLYECGCNSDLCEDCLLAFIKTFKYVPDYFMQDNNHWLNREKHQKVFDYWKLTGEWEQFKFDTYEEIIENSGWFDTDHINKLIQKYYPDRPLIQDDTNNGFECYSNFMYQDDIDNLCDIELD